MCLPPLVVELMTFTELISQPPYPGAKPEEVAEIFVDRFVYSDWETVWVQNRWKDAWPIFRFTAVEVAKALYRALS